MKNASKINRGLFPVRKFYRKYKNHRHRWRIKRMISNKRNKRLVNWQYVVNQHYAINKIGYR